MRIHGAGFGEFPPPVLTDSSRSRVTARVVHPSLRDTACSTASTLALGWLVSRRPRRVPIFDGLKAFFVRGPRLCRRCLRARQLQQGLRGLGVRNRGDPGNHEFHRCASRPTCTPGRRWTTLAARGRPRPSVHAGTSRWHRQVITRAATRQPWHAVSWVKPVLAWSAARKPVNPTAQHSSVSGCCSGMGSNETMWPATD